MNGKEANKLPWMPRFSKRGGMVGASKRDSIMTYRRIRRVGIYRLMNITNN